MSRRDKLREIARDEIKELAWRQMAENGTAALSLGGIARAMELTPSALYRYYGSRDELITALIVDAYTRLADALDASAVGHPAGDYAGRVLVTSLAYRAWALEHPVDFLLIFGNPIPGYHAPAEQTVAAASRVFAAFLSALQEAYEAGSLQPNAEHRALAARAGGEKPPGQRKSIDALVSYVGITGWTKIHGMVILELTGHLQGIADKEAFYRSECVLWARNVGLATARAPAV